MVPNEKEVLAKGNLTFEDYKKHNLHHHKKMMIGYFIFVFLVGLWLSSLFITGGLVAVIPLYLFFSTLIACFFTLVLAGLLHLRVRKEYSSDQLLQNELRYIINEDGINSKVRKSNTYFEWNDFIAVLEHEDMFRLYTSKNKGLVIPKRYFSTKEDIIFFKKLVTRNMDSKKVKIH
ncbi:hypothetical protein GLW04_19425 [Halobacillus litoralis]|uniref:YcxB-like C-terminal domain-containing protein n=1 Tax=Halobacillus litoralis TaxID=45668 RepID=A0A845DZ02_9BACI|nr:MULTISPECIES: YcxB family protein [Halobacillus]MYL22049.1 hypothetical protein [Halobacillus litoralis]MYL31974.1 hypothetical protein [Halobacillus halophilus]MYL39976.1 hypothetical protein [Halobacillus litoralis]